MARATAPFGAAATAGSAGPHAPALSVEGKTVPELEAIFAGAVPVALGDARMTAAPAGVQAAEKFLQQLQRSSEAWAVMAHVLEATPVKDEGASVYFLAEAARVLASKVRHDMTGLATESHDSLRAMLLTHLLRTSGQPDAIVAFRHLAVAMAAAAVTMPAWTGVVPSLLAACGGAERLSSPAGRSEVLAFLAVLLELPGEVDREETSVDPARRDAVRRELRAAAAGVHSVLDAALASHGSDAEVTTACRGVLSAWVVAGVLPLAVIPGSRVMGAILAGMRSEATMEECAFLVLDIADRMSKAVSSERAAVAVALLPPIIAAEPILRGLIEAQRVDDTDSRATTLTAVAASVGFAVIDGLVCDGNALSPHRAGLGRMLAASAASGIRPVQIEALRFWDAFLRASHEHAAASVPVPADVIATARGLLPHLVTCTAMPAADFDWTPISLTASPAEAAAAAVAHFDSLARPDITQEEAAELEAREADTRVIAQWTNSCIDNLCRLMSTPTVVSELCTMTGTALAAAKAAGTAAGSARDPRLPAAEACLTTLGFALDSVFPSTDLPHVEGLLAALGEIPGFGELQRTTLELVRKAASWIAARPPAFTSVVPFLEAHLRQAGPTSSNACSTLEAFIKSDPAAVSSSPLLGAFTANMLRLPNEPSFRVLRASACMVSESESDTDVARGIEALLGPLVSEITAVARDPSAGISRAYERTVQGMQLRGRRPRADAASVKRLGVEGIAAVVRRVPPVIRGLSDSERSEVSGTDLAPAAAALWPCLTALANIGKDEQPIAKAVVGCHTALLTRFPELYADKVGALAADLAARHRDSSFSCYMSCGGELIASLGGTASAPDRAALSEMVTGMAAGGFAVLAGETSVRPFNQNPVLVDDLFVLMTGMAKHLPEEFLSWKHLDDSLRCAYAGLFSSRRVAQCAVLLFLQTVVRIGAPFHDDAALLGEHSLSLADRTRHAAARRPRVTAAISAYGNRIIKRFIAGAAGAMDFETIAHVDGSLTSAILAFRDLLGLAAFRPFFAENLASAVPDSVLHPSVKASIVEDVCTRGVGPTRSLEFERTDAALQRVHSICMAAFRAGRYDIPTS